ncbi:MAG: hypothetical protein RID18_13695 [Cytophagales bacterium]
MSQLTTYYVGAGASAGNKIEEIYEDPIVDSLGPQVLHTNDEKNRHTYIKALHSSYEGRINAGERIPAVASMPFRLKYIQSRIENFFVSETLDIDQEILDKILPAQELLRNDFRWLIDKLNTHKTVDQLASEILTQSNNLEENNEEKNELQKQYEILKLVLAVYFSFDQLLTPTDSRYRTFFSQMCRGKLENLLQSKSKIVSWNYDCQFEIAFAEFMKYSSLAKSNSALNIGTRYYLPFDENRFGIEKLNGTSISYRKDSESSTFFFDELKLNENNASLRYYSPKVAANIIFNYLICRNDLQNVQSGISFSWDAPFEDPSIMRSLSIMQKTRELIIIGYSFPPVNEAIDRRLLQSLRFLHNVVIQDYYPHRIKSRLLTLGGPKIQENVNNGNLRIELLTPEDYNEFALPGQF